MKISRRNFLKGSATTLFLAGFNFPVLANTNLGIRSVEKNLSELFSLYEATRFKRLFKGCSNKKS